jgi:hypothetical protein
MIIWFLLVSFFTVSNTIELNKCNKCKHFLPSSFKGDFFIGYYNGKCNKFLKQHSITGELDFVSIHEARHNEELCGISGTKYKQYNSTDTIENILSGFYD